MVTFFGAVREQIDRLHTRQLISTKLRFSLLDKYARMPLSHSPNEAEVVITLVQGLPTEAQQLFCEPFAQVLSA